MFYLFLPCAFHAPPMRLPLFFWCKCGIFVLCLLFLKYIFLLGIVGFYIAYQLIILWSIYTDMFKDI